MAWVVLFVSAALESVWATALGAADGFTKPVPSLVFALGAILSMVTLAHATKHIPISVAYAIWSGAGAALTVAWAMIGGQEPVSVVKLLLLAGVIGCIAGLKLLKPHAAEAGDGDGDGNGADGTGPAARRRRGAGGADTDGSERSTKSRGSRATVHRVRGS